jgi:hypothetical protein
MEFIKQKGKTWVFISKMFKLMIKRSMIFQNMVTLGNGNKGWSRMFFYLTITVTQRLFLLFSQWKFLLFKALTFPQSNIKYTTVLKVYLQISHISISMEWTILEFGVFIHRPSRLKLEPLPLWDIFSTKFNTSFLIFLILALLTQENAFLPKMFPSDNITPCAVVLHDPCNSQNV